MSYSFTILRIRDFRLMILARLFGMMGMIAMDVIIGWQVYSITRDPFMLGMVGLTEAIPAIMCAFVAGHIVDISRPHRVFIACIGVLTVNATVLSLVALLVPVLTAGLMVLVGVLAYKAFKRFVRNPRPLRVEAVPVRVHGEVLPRVVATRAPPVIAAQPMS